MNKQMDRGIILERLIKISGEKQMEIKFTDLKSCEGLLKGDRIGIKSGMGIDHINYNLAHELAHSYLHYDKGVTIRSEKHEDYEEQAHRAAEMLLDAVSIL